MAKEREPSASGTPGPAATPAAGLFGAGPIPGQPSLEDGFAALRLLAKSEPAAVAAMQLALETMKMARAHRRSNRSGAIAASPIRPGPTIRSIGRWPSPISPGRTR